MEYEHVDNELAKEKERAASYVKLEKTNLFSQKNNVSIATCVSNDINDLALNQEFENKFHHKLLVENFDWNTNECRGVIDGKRTILYVNTTKDFIQNPTTEHLKVVMEILADKCKEHKITKVAISKCDFKLNKLNFNEACDIMENIFSDANIKLIIHEEIGENRVQPFKRSSRNSNKLNLLFTLMCVIFKMILVFCDHKVQGKFKYCTSSINSQIIVNNGNCSAQIANVDTEYDVPFTILEKLTHKINGYGYACVKTKLVLTLTYHWYLASDRLYEMKCKDAYCHGEHKPKGFFKYGQTLFFEG